MRFNLFKRIKCLTGRHESKFVPTRTLPTQQTLGIYICSVCKEQVCKEQSEIYNRALQMQSDNIEAIRATIRQSKMNPPVPLEGMWKMEGDKMIYEPEVKTDV